MTQRRVLTLALSVLTAAAMFTAAVPAASAASPRPAASPNQPANTLTSTVTGTVNGVAQTGTLTVDRFVRQANGIAAVGNLTLGGQNLGTVQAPINSAASGSCQILHLDLGPLNLNLLGLQVSLNQVVLDITAQQGSGNLLGNLLCAVAHLLDNTNALGSVTALLNQILRVLNL